MGDDEPNGGSTEQPGFDAGSERRLVSSVGRWIAGLDGEVPNAPAAYTRYLHRSELPIDILTVCTIWLAVLPFIGSFRGVTGWWTVARVLLSAVYLMDLVIRTRLAGPHQRYVLRHPVAVASVFLPPVRILLSVRLFRSMFHRGNLISFLAVALALMLNGAVVVWAFEHDAPGASITTIGNAVWWAIVTVTTVGYGDYVPVTIGGKVTASLILALGIVTIAVVTATVSSRYRDQATSESIDGGAGPGGASGPGPLAAVPVDELRDLRDRIDALLGSEAERN